MFKLQLTVKMLNELILSLYIEQKVFKALLDQRYKEL